MLIKNSEVSEGSIAESTLLGYTIPVMTREPIYYACDLKYVTQLPDLKICWAACIASIVNCRKGTNLTAQDVAKAYYGSANYNQGLTTGKESKILSDTYGLAYTYGAENPGGGVIFSNIKRGFPVFGVFRSSSYSNTHAMVVYAMNIIRSEMTIMDPLCGCSGISYNASQGKYVYVCAYDGTTYYFTSASCRYWT